MRLSILLLLLCTLVLLKNVDSSPLIESDSSGNEISSKDSKEDNSSSAFSKLSYLVNLLNLKELFKKKARTFGECLTCKFGVAFLQHYAANGATEDDLGRVAYKVCTLFDIETDRVCAGIVKEFQGVIAKVLVEVALDPNEFCGFVFQGCGDYVNPLHNWTVPLTPFPKPPLAPVFPPKKCAPVMRVLHLSDVHLDPYYKEGSNADCGEPLCCRPTSGTAAKDSDRAGLWGDYRNCDVPLRLFESMLDHINRTQQLDYVIWTGDIPPHDIWNTTRNESLYLIRESCQLMLRYLGHLPIFPAVGNHETSPVNSFPTPQVKEYASIDWLYDALARNWEPWVTGSEDTVKLGGFYTALVKPGLRIISLNMNYCNNLNWWLLFNSTDPTGQLAWLVVQLQMSEDKGEKVHIIGHIPPGQPDCLAIWSNNYYTIINRYESTVTAQFFGHTHFDEFEVFYDKSGPTPRPSNIAYIGPSVTTYESVNPGYRIYTVDGDYKGSSMVVLDHETYYLNLTEANLKKEANWKLEYRAKDAFQMDSLLPHDWENFVKKLEWDEDLFQKFLGYYVKLSDYPREPCDSVCKFTYLCKLRRGRSSDPLIC